MTGNNSESDAVPELNQIQDILDFVIVLFITPYRKAILPKCINIIYKL